MGPPAAQRCQEQGELGSHALWAQACLSKCILHVPCMMTRAIASLTDSQRNSVCLVQACPVHMLDLRR